LRVSDAINLTSVPLLITPHLLSNTFGPIYVRVWFSQLLMQCISSIFLVFSFTCELLMRLLYVMFNLTSVSKFWYNLIHLWKSFRRTLTPGHDPVPKVTLVPRGQARGLTWFIPMDDPTLISRQQLFARIVGGLGGRAAEEVIFGEPEVTTGAAGDLQQITGLAKQVYSIYIVGYKI
jgi:hypothetical protein